jgi:hypothetical protein
MIKAMSVDINKLHKIQGNCGETHLKTNVNTYRIKVFGKLEACESCAISKTKKNAIKLCIECLTL